MLRQPVSEPECWRRRFWLARLRHGLRMRRRRLAGLRNRFRVWVWLRWTRLLRLLAKGRFEHYLIPIYDTCISPANVRSLRSVFKGGGSRRRQSDVQ
jgi:hypothetical protein